MKILLLSVLAVAMIGLMVPSAFGEVVLKLDDMGGDCIQFGIWDKESKTCTLSGDISCG